MEGEKLNNDENKFCPDWLHACFHLNNQYSVFSHYDKQNPEYSLLIITNFSDRNKIKEGDAGMEYPNVSLENNYKNLTEIKEDIKNGPPNYSEFTILSSQDSEINGNIFYKVRSNGFGSSQFDTYYIEKAPYFMNLTQARNTKN